MSKQREIVEIRPHHGLCAEFFRGEGYSGEFVRNMGRILAELDKSDPQVKPVTQRDVICEHCPNIGKCGEKAERYDKSVLKICGIGEGQALSWQEYRRLVREKIILAGRLREVCGDCQWAGICSGDA